MRERMVMGRRLPALGAVCAAVVLLAACQMSSRGSGPAGQAPAAESAAPVEAGLRPGLDPVPGVWVAVKPSMLRAAPGPQNAVVGRLRPGEGVTVLGRVRGTDWFAVPAGAGVAYVRFDTLMVGEGGPSTGGRTGGSVVLDAPRDQSAPPIKAAPRAAVKAAPIP